MALRRYVLAALCLCACQLAPVHAATRICVLAAISGPAAPIGASAKTAVDLFNQEPVPGIEVLVLDTKSRADDAQTSTERAARNEGCVAIVGGVTAPEALAIGRVAQREGIPYVETVARVDLSGVGTFVFRISAVDQDEFRAAAQFLANMKLQEVFILSDEFTQPRSGVLQSEIERSIRGSKAVTLGWSSKQENFAKELGQLESAGSAFLLANLRADSLERFARELSSAKPTVRSRVLLLNRGGSPILVSRLAETYPADVFAIAPDNPAWGNGCHGPDCADVLDAHRSFVNRVRNVAKFKSYAEYPAYVAHVYGGLRMVSEAIRKARPTTRESVRSVIETGQFGTPLGRVVIDKGTRQGTTSQFVGRMQKQPDQATVGMESNSLMVRLLN